MYLFFDLLQNRVVVFEEKKIFVNFFFLFSTLKAFCHDVSFWASGEDNMKTVWVCLPVIPVPCYYGRLLLFSIFQCLAVCCAIFWEKISKSVCIYNLLCFHCIIEKHGYHCFMLFIF